MLQPVEIRLGHHELKLGDTRLGEWDKQTGQLILQEPDKNYFSTAGAFHGVMLYSVHRKSHIMPAVVTNIKDIRSRHWLELLYPDKRYMLRPDHWLSNLSKLEQVPAADSLDRFLREKIMVGPDWKAATSQEKLVTLERLINDMDLMQYMVRKNPRPDAEDHELVWWDSMLMCFRDSTTLLITGDGPRVDHDLNEATTYHPKKGIDQSKTYFANCNQAGHA